MRNATSKCVKRRMGKEMQNQTFTRHDCGNDTQGSVNSAALV